MLVCLNIRGKQHYISNFRKDKKAVYNYLEHSRNPHYSLFYAEYK